MKKRVVYGIIALLLLIIEVLIALFVRDSFIRPYGGDILVTMLLCFLIGAVVSRRIKLLPLYVFVFSVLVEIGQHFDFVSLLGLGDIVFFRVLMGTSFSFVDILCYGAGCLLFALAENTILKKLNN